MNERILTIAGGQKTAEIINKLNDENSKLKKEKADLEKALDKACDELQEQGFYTDHNLKKEFIEQARKK